MGTVKRLIVNADDFGRTPGVNRGVIRAHREGIVTSATLLVHASAAAEAAGLARANPSLGLGLQFAFTGGRPLLPAAEVPSLVDASGRLPEQPEGLAAARLDDVLAEARAQLRKFREVAGCRPTHFAAFDHAHTLPTLLEGILTLSWETGLPVRSVSPAMRERLRYERVATPDHFVSDFFGAGVSAENLARILAEVPAGTTELMCHPGEVDDELRGVSSYAELRGKELDVLTDPEARGAVQAGGIRLVHYGGGARGAESG
jgi:predicted glycoside hydrolase/deacetylase ChbG (UPF0249 family)